MYVKLHPSFKADAAAVEAASVVKSCVHCGFCNATCPTYQERFDERDGPRGRIYLVRHLLESGTAGVATRRHLDRCLTCRSCETTCPSGVQYGQLLDAGRKLIDEAVPRPFGQRLVRRLIRWVFPYPGRAGLLLGLGRVFRPFLPPSLRKKVFPKQSRVAAATPTTKADRRMLVLGGCVQSAATPNTNDAATRVLRRLGIDLFEAPTAGCCGAVDYHLGAHEQGLEFARRNIDAWWPHVEEGVEAIVITASGCGVMVKDYGRLLADDPDYSDKGQRVAELAKDLVEVLEEEDLTLLQLPGSNKATAVHCPCTLSHGQQLGGSVQRILDKAGLTLADTMEDHICCGSAGTYSLLQPEMSQALLERKVAALSVDDPEQIVTANIGCQMHLASHADVPVRHWIELLDPEST